ncbi:MAG: hypothetical protein H6742_12640 [Alphaproteobacteria bacterium]|nr:hypothetical protein [Alphaproteobacteria bacterium]
MSRPPTPPTDRLSIVPLPEDLGRERASEERLKEAPLALQEWFDATTEDPHMDARLRAWADSLVPDPDLSVPQDHSDDDDVVQLHPGRWRVATVAVLGLAAAAAAALFVASLDDAPQGDIAPTPAVADVHEPAATPAPVVAPTPAPEPVLAETTPAPEPAPAPPHDAAPHKIAPKSPAPAVAAAPVASPALSERDVIASGSQWQGELVPGLQLAVEQGQARIEGTRAAPRLVLAADSRVAVDIDRSKVDAEFESFVIQTLSAQVEVLGTRYEVTSAGGRTTVHTERGLVEVRCTDGRTLRVAKGQSATCTPQADPSVLANIQAVDRPGEDALGAAEHYDFLTGLLARKDARRFLVTAEVMLDQGLEDDELRVSLELARVDAMCDLGWEEPARGAARAWLSGDGSVGREHAQDIARDGCR